MKKTLEEEVEQLRVQLAGCLTAAEGHIHGNNRASQGNYGWTPAYQAVLELREKWEGAAQAAYEWLYEKGVKDTISEPLREYLMHMPLKGEDDG